MLRRSFRAATKVLVVESPNKVNNIAGYVRALPDTTGGGRPDLVAIAANGATKEPVVVVATVGHFNRLDGLSVTPRNASSSTAKPSSSSENSDGKKDAGSDTLYKFDVTWRVDDSKQRKVAEIADAIRATGGNLSEIIVATDPDREGELIGAHVIATWASKKRGCPAYSRAYFHSITPEGVRMAMQERHLNWHNQSLVRAAEARHVLDRLFGFFASAMVQTVSNSQLKSVGRVQTPALILIHRRETAHREFLRTRATTYGLSAKSALRLPCSGPQEEEVQEDGRGAENDDERTHSCTVTIRLNTAPHAAVAAGAAEDEGDSAGAAATTRAKKKSSTPSSRKGNSSSSGTWSPKSLEGAQKFAAAIVKRCASSSSTVHWALGVGRPISRATQPPQPLTLQALMLRMDTRCRMPSDEVMKASQSLFATGHITYPRTDSVRIEAEPAAQVKAYVAATFGAAAVATDAEIAERLFGGGRGGGGKKKPSGKKADEGEENKKQKRSKKKSAEPSNVEDAHEALRPTDMARKPEALGLSGPERLVYEEIHRVTTAAFMRAQVVETRCALFATELDQLLRGDNVEEAAHDDAHTSQAPPPGAALVLRLSASRVVDPGFSAAMAPTTGTEGEEAASNATTTTTTTGNNSKLYAALELAEQDPQSFHLSVKSVKAVERKASPPPLLSEGTLIAELKKHGIGRPSTYATILATLRTRGYATVDPSTGKLHVTDLGRHLVRVAERYFATFVDVDFTARMEGTLDTIAAGGAKRDSLLSSVWAGLLASAPAAARASYYKDGESADANPDKAQLVRQRVPPFGAPSAGATSFDDYCSRVRSYLRRVGNFQK